jgi:sulfur carrier protein ThiS
MRKNRSRWIFGACVACAGFVLADQARASVTLFDSHGFESSAGYVAGNASLTGQPASAAANQKWVQLGPSTPLANPPYPFAGVISITPSGLLGSQLVGVADTNIAATDFGYWSPATYQSPNTAFTPGSSGPTDNVVVAWTEAYNPGATQNPFFGIQVFNGAASIALVGIDATNNLMVIQNPSGTSELGADHILFAPSTYYNFSMDLDYAHQTYAVSVNGNVIDSESFASAATQFTDADILTYVLGDSTANGSGYFDNYLVTAVPEPANISLMASALILLGMGRRLRRTRVSC